MKRRFESDATRQKIEKVKALTKIADELGCSTAQLAIAWCFKNPNVSSVITGASRKSQVDENMKALDVAGQLDNAVIEKIENVLQNKPKGEEDYR